MSGGGKKNDKELLLLRVTFGMICNEVKVRYTVFIFAAMSDKFHVGGTNLTTDMRDIRVMFCL